MSVKGACLGKPHFVFPLFITSSDISNSSNAFVFLSVINCLFLALYLKILGWFFLFLAFVFLAVKSDARNIPLLVVL